MLGQHPDTTSPTGIFPPGRWITPDGCFINRFHPSRRRFLLAVAMGGDVDPAGDSGVEKVAFTVVQPSSPAVTITVTEQSAKKGGWWRGVHDSPLTTTDGQVEFYGYCYELDLTTLDEGPLYITAVPTMKSGQTSTGLDVLTVYNESQTNAGIRPHNRQVFLDPVNGSDTNGGWQPTLAVQTLAVAMDKARGGNQADASGCVIQVMNDLDDMTATPNPINTQGRWPLTFLSYGGRRKMIGGGTWNCVGSSGLRMVFEGFDFVDGGIVLDSGPDYRREVELVGCKTYPSWWGQPLQDIRALATEWLPAKTTVGNSFSCKSYHCEHLGGYWGVWQDFLFDCKVQGCVAEAVRILGAEWTVVACEFAPVNSQYGALDVTGNSFTVFDIPVPGIFLLNYTSYTAGTDVDIAEQAFALKGLTDLGLKLGTLGIFRVFDVGYDENGNPWVALLGAGPASPTVITDLQTCRMSDGVTWGAAATLHGVATTTSATEGIMQDMLFSPGFSAAIASGGYSWDRVMLWNIGIDEKNGETTTLTLNSAVTNSVLANISCKGTLELSTESADAWTDTVVVDCVFGNQTGLWPTGTLAMANHWETGGPYGQEATTGPWFVAEGLQSVEGTLGTGKGWRAAQGVWRASERILSSWVTD